MAENKELGYYTVYCRKCNIDLKIEEKNDLIDTLSICSHLTRPPIKWYRNLEMLMIEPFDDDTPQEDRLRTCMVLESHSNLKNILAMKSSLYKIEAPMPELRHILAMRSNLKYIPNELPNITQLHIYYMRLKWIGLEVQSHRIHFI